MNRFLTLVFALGASLLLNGCQTAEPSVDESYLTSLHGSWDSGCVKTGKASSERILLAISDTEISGQMRSFADHTCGELVLTADYAQTYTIATERADDRWPAASLANPVDLTIRLRKITYATLEPNKVAAGALSNCRAVAKDVKWEVGVAVDVSAYDCFPPWTKTFQILSVKNNVLRFGELNAVSTGQTEGQRPAYLSSTLSYHKTMQY